MFEINVSLHIELFILTKHVDKKTKAKFSKKGDKNFHFIWRKADMFSINNKQLKEYSIDGY
ncbi:hypothetical protein GCE9029_03610 [Grimontia celer]|uniref:Uncharacterized protein n=1 Tax=Grimontia celer TaxID=1796497 RepID=A0A128F974_9GAMM|nr:hypothetical protein GCE9029_03610 [Grimontia celer]